MNTEIQAFLLCSALAFFIFIFGFMVGKESYEEENKGTFLVGEEDE